MNDNVKIAVLSILKEAYTYWLSTNEQLNNKPFKKSMLHNDPNLRNVMINNEKVTFLDWELSSIGDPQKEVAHICACYGLNDELTNVFLSAYYSREPTNEELDT